MLAIIKAMITSVSLLITQMTKKMTSQSTRLLTGLCAMLAPQQESDVFSFRDLSNILGINRCAKYLQDGLRNREAYDNFLAFDGSIQPGERVVCRGGDDGELVAMDGNSITIKLRPFGTKVTYPRLQELLGCDATSRDWIFTSVTNDAIKLLIISST